MLFKTFIRKQLRLKAHTVTEIEPSDEQMVVQIERLGARKLCCSRCRRPYRRVHSRAVRERSWRDLSLRQAPLVLRYRSHRVRSSRCGFLPPGGGPEQDIPDGWAGSYPGHPDLWDAIAHAAADGTVGEDLHRS